MPPASPFNAVIPSSSLSPKRLGWNLQELKIRALAHHHTLVNELSNADLMKIYV